MSANGLNFGKRTGRLVSLTNSMVSFLTVRTLGVGHDVLTSSLGVRATTLFVNVVGRGTVIVSFGYRIVVSGTEHRNCLL